jgi:hypothetical protein
LVDLTKIAQTGVKLGKKVDLGKEKSADIGKAIEDATKELVDLAKKLDEPCDKTQEQDTKPPKERAARGTGKKKVQVRPPRKYTARDVKRIAKKVLDESGNCVGEGALIAAAVLGTVGAEHWLDILIRILGHIHDLYQILYDYSDFSGYIYDVEAAKIGGAGAVIDAYNAVLDFIIKVLGVPRGLVLLLKPVDDFIMAFKRFLERFYGLIVSML